MSRFTIPNQIIYVCTGSKCGKKGGKDCYKELKSYIKNNKMKRDTEVIRIECSDRCKFAPVLNFQPQNIWLKEYSEKEVIRLLEKL
ncbi:(2Fe-2S) ferredoxin domain-containing protein [Pseudopedobacter beijingensis]|uniref:(2Fe-2S) ferredoxin domain-containing protein n=1 Tax=Pseudopedobacter beijingensis TaxID=1207056 RepID=A0ABW4IAV3_9SPHI